MRTEADLAARAPGTARLTGTVEPDPPARGPARRRGTWAAALLLAAAQAGLLAATAFDKSDTVDEPHYLATAIPQWRELDFSASCDIPALPKWGFALALRVVDPDLFAETSKRGRHPLWSRPPPETRRNLIAARTVTIALTVAGGLFLWAAARRFGEGCALLTHTLWCFSPTVLAQGSLATLDAWVTSLSCAVIWSTVRLAERPNLRRAAGTGVALALAAASKVTALGQLPVVAAVGAWTFIRSRRARGESWARPLLAGALCLGLAFGLTLWAAYGFEIGRVDAEHPCAAGGPSGAAAWGPLPFATWLEGLLAQSRHGQAGHLNYLFGRSGSTGWWWFYLAALALKTTVGSQLLVALRLAAWAKSRPGRESLLTDAALLAYPVLLVAVMSLGRTQNGIKYILPAFPFGMLWAGRAVGDARRAFGSRGLAGIGACALLALVESLSVHPHHLMFFNLWAGGPAGGPRYLIHGDDWGQDQRRLGEWQRVNRPWRLFYTYYNGDPGHWGVIYQEPPCEPQPGHYALHAVEVHRPKRMAPGCLDWLTVEAPDMRLGYSIYLYQVNKPRIERLKQERLGARPFWRSGPLPAGPGRLP